LLISHPLIQQAPVKRRGKVARALANAIAIAARVDFNHGEPIGERLLEKLNRVLARNSVSGAKS
jgi:RNA processing factor Prp31